MKRIISWMKNSSTVEVKDKCKLGKLNGRSAACNQGDISNFKIKPINEEIDASEAYDANGTINTLINGKRDVGLLLVNKLDAETRRNMSMHDINAIPVIKNNGSKSFIIYTNKEKAGQLRNYMINHGGYAADTTPEEALTVGKLLGYTDKSIDDYIRKRYKKIPVDTRTADDFNSLDESSNTYVNVSKRDHKGWITPDNKFIASNNHISYLALLYPEMNTNYNNWSKIYDRAYHDGYTKIEFNEGYGTGFGILAIHAPNEERLAILLSDIYYKLVIREGKIYYDTGESDSNNSTHGMFELPKDKYKLDLLISKNVKKSNLNEAEIYSLDQLPFTDEINKLGGKIYSVGGAVRDKYLGKESKDLDIMITGVPMDTLEQILGKYGQVNLVGKSFGVLKFKPNGSTEDIDVAIPRTDTSTGAGGHKGIETKSDHTLPIEDDLRRRDLTINAIANDIEGNVIDPFGGVEDIRNKIIRMVNPSAFTEDPLRMLRAVQMASRFGFTIEPETMKAIQGSVSRIKEIPSERILTEFDKIVQKGDHLIGANLLVQTGIYRQLFGASPVVNFNSEAELFRNAKTMGEFIYLLLRGTIDAPDEFFKTKLRGDINTYKDIKALKTAYDSYNDESMHAAKARSVAYNMFAIYPESLKSDILPQPIKIACNELLAGKYPKSNADLPVNGNDLINLGFRGEQIKNKFKDILLKIYIDKLKNNREDILKYLGSDTHPAPSTTSSLNETIKGGEYVMYHGSKYKFDRFTDEFVGKENATDQEGPGIYFTESEEEAHIYGDYIYSVVLRPRKLTNTANKKVVSISAISSLIKMSPQWKEDAQNYDINPTKGLAIAISSIIEYSENEKDLYQQVWIDFFRYQPRLFVQGMTKLGFDGELINKDYGGVKHIIVYNPAIITITNVVSTLPDATSENFNLQESSENEGVADKYAANKFGIPNPDDEFEKDYKVHLQTQEEKPVGYVLDTDNNRIAIYRNPRSLSNFAEDVRAIGDPSGDIYVALQNSYFTHSRMAENIGLFVDGNEIYSPLNLKKYTLMHRIGLTNGFGLGDAQYEIMNDENENDGSLINNLRKLKNRNPQYKFYPDFYNFVKPNDKFVEESVDELSTATPMNKKSLIAYSAIVLDEKSKVKLHDYFKNLIPDEYEYAGDHMTINFGEIDSFYEKFLGYTVRLKVDSYALDENTMAVGVSGFGSLNDNRHITIAVNRKNGATAKMSNNLKNWIPFRKPLYLIGTVKEIEFKL